MPSMWNLLFQKVKIGECSITNRRNPWNRRICRGCAGGMALQPRSTNTKTREIRPTDLYLGYWVTAARQSSMAWTVLIQQINILFENHNYFTSTTCRPSWIDYSWSLQKRYLIDWTAGCLHPKIWQVGINLLSLVGPTLSVCIKRMYQAMS